MLECRATTRWIGFQCIAFCIWGCTTPTEPPEKAGGGQRYILDYDTYVVAVDPVLTKHGCNAEGNCHGGGIRGTLELTPSYDRNLIADFEQISLQVRGDDPSGSPLLTKPLAVSAGGRPHSFEPFVSVDHPDYQVLLNWIEAGVWDE